MNDITGNFGQLYYPVSALVIYQTPGTHSDTYVEHFNIDRKGIPVDAHPLTEREAVLLGKALNVKDEKKNDFLKPKGILPVNILHINPGENGSVLWYTKAGKAKLFFAETLDIPDGTAEVPALLWYAGRNSLSVFALASNRRPTEKTRLYHAPFFNVYESGSVCMGNVNVSMKNCASVERFIQLWESYFFNSYFSHLIDQHNPVKGNIVNIWKELIKTGKPFPKEVLKRTNTTIKKLLP